MLTRAQPRNMETVAEVVAKPFKYTTYIRTRRVTGPLGVWQRLRNSKVARSLRVCLEPVCQRASLRRSSMVEAA